MPLPLSGAIRMGADVNVELSNPVSTQIALGQSTVRTLYGIASGAIRLSADGYGKASVNKLVGTLQSLITPTTLGQFPQQGSSVSLSKDGNTLAIGAPIYNTGTGYTGATVIYVRSGSTWSQQATLISNDYTLGSGIFSGQGSSVSLSDDGNTLAVGGYTDNNYVGATFIFTRSGTTWTQQGSKIVGSGSVGNAEQGLSVSLSSDGNTLAVGGYADNSSLGATWIFTRSGSTWSQQSKLIPSGNIGLNPQFGWNVNLSADGNTLAAGAINDNFISNGATGATWIFTRSGSTWSQQAKLVGTGVIDGGYGLISRQGSSVSLSDDGNTLATGGDLDNYSSGSSAIGAIWIFTRAGSTWSQQAKLVGTGYTGTNPRFRNVSLSTDGNLLAVGAPNDNFPLGAVWLFSRSGTTWTQKGSKLVPTDYTGSSSPRFGWSVALSKDGNNLACGGPYNSGQVGSVWLFT